MREYRAVSGDDGETGCSTSATAPRSMSVRRGVMVAAGLVSVGLASEVCYNMSN